MKSLLLLFVAAWSLMLAQSKSGDEEMAVTCGSVIKILSAEANCYLSSEERQLGAGSGQQIVTFQKSKGTQNTLWHVRPANHGKESETEYPDEATCQLAEPIPCNTAIRLTHLTTQKNLHSHGVPSPMSKQQEVTAFGSGDGKGDGGDDWIVRCVSPKAKFWKRGEPFHLFHRDTSKYLGTSKKLEFNQNTCGHQCPIMGHFEAFGRGANDQFTILQVEQGIHLSK